MKIILDLNQKLADLDGNPIEGQLLGEAVSNRLVSVSRGNAIKYLDWAIALHKGKKLELDQADYQELYKFVEDQPDLTILAKGQIIKLMLASKDAANRENL